HRLYQPDRDGAKSSLTLSIFSGEDQVDPVEELLQVDIHHDAVPGRNVRLRLRHRLMRRAAWPEP
ncbi:hypothetical protein, partial [Bradyrhizobium denitrificans]|uniref:hypothetical protein n=1 Tax=Bradyrhizobium denitrificans TaxID=2734912 RepID=UPI00202337E9